MTEALARVKAYEEQIEQMLAELGTERPGIDLPSMAQVLSAYEGVRHHAVGLGIARDIGFRMPPD